MRMALPRIHWLLLLLGSLAMHSSAMGTARSAQGKMLNPKNFEVLGVSLSESTVADVVRILGTAPSKQGPNAEISISCYTSQGSDMTVLEFEYWFETMVEFRLFLGTPQSASDCSKSKLVSANLATGSGLRLGMSKDEVIALLGSPSIKKSNRLTYDFSYDRPPTSEEIKLFKHQNATPPVSINVYGRIALQFRDGKLVSIDVLRGEDY